MGLMQPTRILWRASIATRMIVMTHIDPALVTVHDHPVVIDPDHQEDVLDHQGDTVAMIGVVLDHPNVVDPPNVIAAAKTR